MKTTILFLRLLVIAIIVKCLLPISNLYGQTPQAIPYQAVARDVNGNLIANQNIALQFTIIQGSIIPVELYKETQSVTTNELGLFTANVGQGSPVIGTFYTINWGMGAYPDKYLKVELDATGGTNYIDMGQTQMLSVPYALYSATSGNGLSPGSATGNTMYWDGFSWVNDHALFVNHVGFGPNSNIGINTDSPGATLHINGNENMQAKFTNNSTGSGVFDGLQIGLNGTSSYIVNMEQTDLTIGSGAGGQMTLTAAGNVGIGTSGPSSKLEVTGQVKITGGSPGVGKVLTSDVDGLATWNDLPPTGWGLTGNSNTADGVNYIGTNNNVPLNFKVNGQRSGRIDATKGNTFLGFVSGNDITTGISNTGVGKESLNNNNSGFANTAIGSGALYSTTIGSNNTANGVDALYSNTEGTGNIAMGQDALYYNKKGGNGVAIGTSSQKFSNNQNAVWNNSNTSIGFQSLRGSTNAANNTGNSNTAVGYNAIMNNTTGYANTATGEDVMLANTTGYFNTASGAEALFSNTTGRDNIAIGASALYNNISGDENVVIGSGALFSSTGQNGVVAIGYQSQYYAQPGAFGFARTNTSIGYQSLMGSNNPVANTGNYSTAIGFKAMAELSSGIRNTGVGSNALYELTTGSNNTAVGDDAGAGIESGNYNTTIGKSSIISSPVLNNTTSIGYHSGYYILGSNSVQIGSDNVSWIGGEVGWSTFSDSRIKDNVTSNVPGLSFISKLRPVTYNLNIHKQDEMMFKEKNAEEENWPSKYDIEKIKMTGFIAQEVEQAAKESSYDFSGVQKPVNEQGLYSIRYSDFVMPLVKAVQELSTQNETLKVELEEMKTMIVSLQNNSKK